MGKKLSAAASGLEWEPVLRPSTCSGLLGSGRAELGGGMGLLLKSVSSRLLQLLKPGAGKQEMGRSRRGRAQVSVLAAPLGSSVTLGRSLTLSGLQFSPL